MPTEEEIQSGLEGFEDQWARSEEAEAGTQYLLLPRIAYQCAIQGFEWFKTPTKGTIGLKLHFEIVNPESHDGLKLRGRVIEHVLWMTEKNIPYVKRDVKTITGQSVNSVRDLQNVNWCGHFAEVVNDHEVNPKDQKTYNRIGFINAWNPSGPAPAGPRKPPAAEKESAAVASKKGASAPDEVGPDTPF